MDKFFISAFAYLISLLIFWPSKTLFANFCLNIVRRILLTTKILFCTFFLFLKKIQKYFSVYEAFFFFSYIKCILQGVTFHHLCLSLEHSLLCGLAFQSCPFQASLEKGIFSHYLTEVKWYPHLKCHLHQTGIMLGIISIRIIPKETSLCLSPKCFCMMVSKRIDMVISNFNPWQKAKNYKNGASDR